MATQLLSNVSTQISGRIRAPFFIPTVVIASTLALLVWASWPMLSVNRSVEITQAIFVPSSFQDTEHVDTRDSTIPQSTRTVQAAGWLEADPFHIAATALADGVVEEVLVLEGDSVEEGQVLARLVDDDAELKWARAQAQLEVSAASLESAQAFLAAAQKNWDEPFELERLVETLKASLAEHHMKRIQALSYIESQAATLIHDQESFARVRDAFERDAAAEIEFISARERVNAQQAELNAMTLELDVLDAVIRRIEAELKSARIDYDLRIDDQYQLSNAKAMLAKAHANHIQYQVLLDEAQLELDRMVIRSPISGYVQRRLKVPGDKVVRMMDSPHSAHIAHIYDPSQIQVRVDVPLADASQLFVGQRCEVVVEVLADQVFMGEVTRVTHEADLQKNTLQVKVRVEEPSPVLRPEMLTRVKFLSDTQEQQEGDGQKATVHVQVPLHSIDHTDGLPRVWVVSQRSNGRGVLESKGVQSIGESDGWITIAGDIQPGALIVANPSGCKEGESVRFERTSWSKS